MGELSTGTRRIVELGALIALDSPPPAPRRADGRCGSEGNEAFAPLIRTVKDELGAAILIIEHDMPMVMSISDRIYCLEAGQVIAEGAPAEIRSNPAVIASYLGTDERAIQRSNTGSDVGGLVVLARSGPWPHRGLELDNRVFLPAMDMNLCEEGHISEGEIAHYRAGPPAVPPW